MTDARIDTRMDALLRRLDVAAEPDEAFVSESLSALLPRVDRARAADRRWFGRLWRDLRAATAGPFWSPGARRTFAIAMALLVLLLVLAAVVIVVGSKRQLPPPFGLAANGQIVFVADNHVVLANADGTNRRQISSDPGKQENPTFSRDGTRLAWQRFKPTIGDQSGTGDAVVADADGSNQLVIATDVSGMSHIAWSPDGRFVSFTGSIDGGPNGAWTAPSDGSASPRAFMTTDDPWDPTWSPDGNRLAVGTRNGLVVVNRDGSDPHVVNHQRFQEVGERGEIAEWSPDGTMLLFTAVTGDPSIPVPDDYVPYSQQVWVIRLDGSPERQLSRNTERARDAVWSPDGTRIAYMRAGNGHGPIPWITDLSGTHYKMLPGFYGWYQPIWSPDGTKLVLTDDGPGPNDSAGPAVRVIVDVDGKEPPIVIPAAGVTPDDVPDWAASWQRLAR